VFGSIESAHEKWRGKGASMTAFQFFGGLLIFGLLWLVFPRTSFAMALSACLTTVYKINLFPGKGAGNALDTFAMTIILLVGCICGLILDIVEHKKAMRW